jgi:hypothetical protein
MKSIALVLALAAGLGLATASAEAQGFDLSNATRIPKPATKEGELPPDAIDDQPGQTSESALRLEGYADLHGGFGNADLDDRKGLSGATLNLRASLRLSGTVRASVQTVVQLPSFDDNPLGRHLLREAFLEWRGERADVSIGRRVFVWGTGDGYNPTSTVTPSDFRYLGYEDNGERFGVDHVRARLFLGEQWTVSVLLLPVFRSSILSEGQLPPVLRAIAKRDDGDARPLGLAARLEQRGDGFDFSLVAHRGRATSPVFGVAASGYEVFNPEQSMLGFDVSLTRGPIRLFAEGALLRYRDRADLAAFLPRDEATLVAGIEYELSGGSRLQAQGLLRSRGGELAIRSAIDAVRAINRVTFGQFRPTDLGASLSVRSDTNGEQLVAELTGSTWFTDGSWYARSRIKRRLDDSQSLYLRADLLRGRQDSIFGSLRANSRVLLEYRFGF